MTLNSGVHVTALYFMWLSIFLIKMLNKNIFQWKFVANEFYFYICKVFHWKMFYIRKY